MFQKTAFCWPPQPSTVIGLGVLAGSVCYLITGDPIWAGVAAALVKILVPDNSEAAKQVSGAIEILAQALGRPLPTPAQQAPVASGDRGSGAGSPDREPPEK